MSKNDIVNKHLADLQRAHREGGAPVAPAADFTASVMRSVRTLEDPGKQALFEQFLWQMTYIPATCALVILLFAVPYGATIGSDILTQLTNSEGNGVDLLAVGLL